MNANKCRAGTLANNAEVIAPVSGCRCRLCGANARMRPADQTWTIYNRAAYCPECVGEAAREPVREG